MSEDKAAEAPATKEPGSPKAAAEPGAAAQAGARGDSEAPRSEGIVEITSSLVPVAELMPTGKRRGRPPGSKNKVKEPPPPPPPPPKAVRAPRPKQGSLAVAAPAAQEPLPQVAAAPPVFIPRSHSQILHELYASERASLRDHYASHIGNMFR